MTGTRKGHCTTGGPQQGFAIAARFPRRYHEGMTRIVNLRTARKQAQRDRKREAASVKAEKHGLSEAEKRLKAARDEQARAYLDGHKREE